MNEFKAAYKHLIVFWFSGTGNAKKIAEHITQTGKEKGMHTASYNITKLNEDNFPQIQDDTLIGFCSPTHGFNMPPIMLKFTAQFKRCKSKNTHVFIVNTRAGMKLYKLFLPGLSGVAQYLTAFLLRLKGYKIKGYQPMDMPSNWISLHPGIRHKVVMSIVARCKRKTIAFTEKIIQGKRISKGWLSLPFDLAIAPIAVLYYFIGRFAIAKTFYATSACDHCGICIKQCPVKAISEIGGINYWAFTCESCMKCMNVCPKRAIETAHGYTFLLWWLVMSVLGNLILTFLLEQEFIKDRFSEFAETGLYNLIVIGLIFLIVFLGYKLLHLLLRYKWFNKLMAYTSLTRYKFWRRYRLSDHVKAEKTG